VGRGTSKAILSLLVCALAGSASQAQFGKLKKSPEPPSEEVQQVLAWLPADTETVVVANGPFSLPDLGTRDEETPGVESFFDLEENFEALPLGLFGFKGQILSSRLLGQKVAFAIEGARHFQITEGLGTAPFEGCSIAVFQRDVSDRAAAFLKDSAKRALPSEQIEDQKVAVFQAQLENDQWTFYVDFPKPTVALACTNRDYLREVLVRMRDSRGVTALPDNLPEWKYIDTHDQFWGLRHFTKPQPGSAPAAGASVEKPTEFDAGLNGDSPAYVPDDQPIGLTFRLDPSKSRTAVLTYFSGDKDIVHKLKDSELSGSGEPEPRALDVIFSEIAPGVVSIAYHLGGSPDSVNHFLVLLGTSLGHAIFI
jgi:hypothetical protein